MSQPTLELFEDLVAISPLDGTGVSRGGIMLPETAIQKPTRGIVVAVGPGRLLADGTRSKVPVKVGDTVIFPKHSGNEIEIGTATLTFMRAVELMCRINGLPANLPQTEPAVAVVA